ncbi:methionine--tRNA ligase [Acholeplasma equirhinis]|uniref:methionine--tRNA ligase n=1 Tax=Acholeplasma equirhinis TaxID=555393 RepID=UPI00197ACDD6|nr:methionine--tRNA ligase [Acholeplasma equirhinis]MBN3490911.1 methionine--tRNA ligase [Acholeplasma equirhinis]
MEKKPYYISTAIAYASAIPHIGNVYEVILADAIARYKRLTGFDVYFQTGTDEHGQKIENKAKQQDLNPQAYVDMISGEIKRIYDLVGVSYDKFVRTSDPQHKAVVQKIFDKLLKQGDIYLGKYEGWYSIADEAFLGDDEIVDGKGPSGDIPVWMSEDTYFLKLSKYQQRLLKHIEENPEFIQPESRKNEVLQNFLKEELPDLSVSRTSFKWGIPVLADNKHITYVWIDALSNYITGIGYDLENPAENFKKFWPADVHLIGKDIIRFHVIYWPIILMALGVPLPKKIFGHPWVLVDKNKMSKSVGNTLYTDKLVQHFGVDAVRYYVLHEIPYAQDGNITYELMIERTNSDLANTLGNLVNRTIGMINKYQEGMVYKVQLDQEPFEYALRDKCLALEAKVTKLMDELKVGDALEELISVARAANKYIDLSEPWNLNKNGEKEKLSHVLYSLVETIRVLAVYLQAFIPTTAASIFEQLDSKDKDFETVKSFGYYPEQKIGTAKVLFERFDPVKKLNEIIG